MIHPFRRPAVRPAAGRGRDLSEPGLHPLSRPSFEIVPQAVQDQIDLWFTIAFAICVLGLAGAVWFGRPPEPAAAETLLLLFPADDQSLPVVPDSGDCPAGDAPRPLESLVRVGYPGGTGLLPDASGTTTRGAGFTFTTPGHLPGRANRGVPGDTHRDPALTRTVESQLPHPLPEHWHSRVQSAHGQRQRGCRREDGHDPHPCHW